LPVCGRWRFSGILLATGSTRGDFDVLTILAFAIYAAISAACFLITFLEGWAEHDR